MKIRFYVRFHTHPGESLAIYGADYQVTPLQYLNSDYWQGTMEADPAQHPHIRYKYQLTLTDGTQLTEGGDDRIIDTSHTGIEEIDIYDVWNNPAEFENIFFTQPFQEVLLKSSEAKVKQKLTRTFTHIFRVKAPLLKKHEVVCLLGDSAELGEWNTYEPLLLKKEGHWWMVKLDLSSQQFSIAYKYGVYDTKKKSFIGYEAGGNRVTQGERAPEKITILQDGFIHLPNDTWRGAGVAIPIFSLRSKNSFGIGEFTDLKLLADWVSEAGMKLIQILPVNDTTATHTRNDSYPYAAISAFALHPVYINLEEVAGKKYADLLKPFRKKQKQLNELPDLDYEEVMKEKLAALRSLFAVQKEEFLQDPEYQQFFEENKHWLVPYAAFCYLRDKNGTADYNQWKIYSQYDKGAIQRYVSPRAKHYNEIAASYFIQYHLHLQLKEAAEYLHKKGIILKGDLPIGIYRYSCDAWMNPELYNMDMQAGAPPDAFTDKGQNWGFPTYNWQKMEEDGFAWWRQRFRQMGSYFDAIRIDHILGFFRIWSIPLPETEGLKGHFEPVDESTWEKEGIHRLSALKHGTDMLVCGEDLGVVPAFVPDALKRLGILCLEVQRMPKKNSSQKFSRPADAFYLSVVTPSTHDMSTVRGWWKEDQHDTQHFFNMELGHAGKAPDQCEPWISKDIVVQHLQSPAMWSIFLLQDLTDMNEALRSEDPEQERINNPAINPFYWKFRMRFTLEHLLKEKEFNHALKEYIRGSGR